MRICIDFDGTLVEQYDHAYEDLKAPLQLVPGAREALRALKRAGHKLILFSARANRSIRYNPLLDELARPNRPDPKNWPATSALNQARYKQMLDFVREELPGVFDAVDSGAQGKPCADLFIDDKALRFGHEPGSVTWIDIAASYGETLPKEAQVDEARRQGWVDSLSKLIEDHEFNGGPGVLGTIDGATIRLVDSSQVMTDYSMDFTVAGHGYVYDFIPKDEVWAYDSIAPEEALFDLYHELIERALMSERGFGYETAHAVANEYERELRVQSRR